MGNKIVKVRKQNGQHIVSIPNEIALELDVEYLLVAFEKGRLVYTPIETRQSDAQNQEFWTWCQ
jgi:hypothetical protein